MQGGASPPLRLAGTDHQQHLGAVERQQPDCRPGSGSQRFEGLDVSADGVGHLTAGQFDVAELENLVVAVPTQGGDHQIAEVHSGAQWVEVGR
jgi:hypothetical protein